MSGKATLYLRGLPERVVRHAKVEAARRGVTLSRFVADAITKAVGREADAELPEVLRADEEWYEQNRTRLLKQHEGEYLAIAQGKVVDHDTDFSQLSRRVFSRLGPHPVFMPKCVETEEVVRIRGPRVRRS